MAITVGELNAKLSLDDQMEKGLAAAEKRAAAAGKNIGQSFDDAATEAKRAADKIKDASLGVEKAQTRAAAAFKKAGGDSLEYRSALREVEKAQDRLASAKAPKPIEIPEPKVPEPDTSKFESKLGGLKGKTEDSMKGAMDGAKDTLSGGMGELGTVAAGGFAAIGALAAKGLVDEFNRTVEREHETTKLGAQLGLNGPQAAKLGKIAGDLYSDNFGDSTAQLSDAMKLYVQNVGGLGDITEPEFKKIISQVVTVADVFDQDLGATTRAIGKMVKTGLAPDAETALDIITKGLQEGDDQAGDLLDTFSEYSTQFRALGLDGKTALGLIHQGLKGGARDADTVADGLKELAIRAKDGTAKEAFARLGLDGTKMGDDIAAGGDRARGAVDLILTKLGEVKDPLDQSQIAVGMFGPKAEDLQGALNKLDSAHAVEQLGQVKGAAQGVTDSMGEDKQAKIEGWTRNVQGWFDNVSGAATDAAASVPFGLWTIGQTFEQVGNDMVDFTTQLPQRLADAGSTMWNFMGDSLKLALNTVAALWNGIQIPAIGPFSVEAFGKSIDIGPYGPFDLPDLPTFDAGGRVPGMLGSSQLIQAHGGEYVLPTHRMPVGAALGAVGLGSSTVDNSRRFTANINVNGSGNPVADAQANAREMSRAGFYNGIG